MCPRFARLVVFLGVWVLIVSAACDEDDITGVRNTDFAAEDTFSFEVGREARTALVLEGINGTVEVNGSPGAASVSISGVIRVESDSFEDASAHLALLDVVVDSTATEVRARTTQPQNSEGRNYLVYYIVSVPPEFAVNVTNVNGVVTIQSIAGDTTVLGANGTIVADAISGNATMTLANGGVSASAILPSGGVIDIDVSNGFIELAVPLDTSAEFSAMVGTGTITLSDLTLSGANQTPRSLTGTLGGGDGVISLTTVNGNITVRGS
jgi:DUF4097 and DUF4098 domain-containing protein YvlB